MNPVIRDILDNIGRLGRELERQPNTQNLNEESRTSGHRGNEGQVRHAVRELSTSQSAVEDEVSRQFGRCIGLFNSGSMILCCSVLSPFSSWKMIPNKMET